jgi:hypothetical protein
MAKIMYYTGKYEVWLCRGRAKGLEQDQSTEDYIRALYRKGYHLRDQAGVSLDVDDVIHPGNWI